MTKSRDLANAATALNAVTAAELGFVDGVTSAIQTQIDTKLATATAATTYVPNSLADAKGDLLTATADNTPARLAVGSNGDTIVADSSTSTGLRYQGNFAAGKNKIINGDFNIWQRGTTFNGVTTGSYTADRWSMANILTGNTFNITRETFTPGSAPVAGYEGKYFMRIAKTVNSSGQSGYFGHKIEDVQTLAGQTVTLSYWAKVTSGTMIPNRVFLNQQFGSGGSAETDSIGISQPTYTTTWTRFTNTFTVPSIAGKTIGTNSNLWFLIEFSGLGTFNLDLWGVQLEAGSVATAFQTATGTIQGELAACQRYYQVAGTYSYGGRFESTSVATIWGVLPVVMRTTPTLTYTSLTNALLVPGVAQYTPTAFTFGGGTSSFQANFTGMTGGVLGNMATINVASNLSAEL